MRLIKRKSVWSVLDILEALILMRSIVIRNSSSDVDLLHAWFYFSTMIAFFLSLWVELMIPLMVTLKNSSISFKYCENTHSLFLLFVNQIISRSDSHDQLSSHMTCVYVHIQMKKRSDQSLLLQSSCYMKLHLSCKVDQVLFKYKDWWLLCSLNSIGSRHWVLYHFEFTSKSDCHSFSSIF